MKDRNQTAAPTLSPPKASRTNCRVRKIGPLSSAPYHSSVCVVERKESLSAPSYQASSKTNRILLSSSLSLSSKVFRAPFHRRRLKRIEEEKEEKRGGEREGDIRLDATYRLDSRDCGCCGESSRRERERGKKGERETTKHTIRNKAPQTAREIVDQVWPLYSSWRKT